MAQQDDRPAPDALLAEARKEGRGKLKVFLGAYPGVGKTYAMLQAAQERRREGIDVVVGIAETHGRTETEALLRGLDVLARKRVLYRGRVFGEMDLDAILWRKPRLVLVDELAHTNVEGGRHEKRWQDVGRSSPPASTSTPRSTSSTSKASTTSSPASRASASAKPCPTRRLNWPTRSN